MVAVLITLGARAPEPSHGYDLCRALHLKAGTVYPLLMRLAERGLVETEWEQDPPQGRPARHLYRLSARGEQLLAELERGAVGLTHVDVARSGQLAVGGAAE